MVRTNAASQRIKVQRIQTKIALNNRRKTGYDRCTTSNRTTCTTSGRTEMILTKAFPSCSVNRMSIEPAAKHTSLVYFTPMQQPFRYSRAFPPWLHTSEECYETKRRLVLVRGKRSQGKKEALYSFTGPLAPEKYLSFPQ